jgi:hypothetical protein
MSAASVGRVHGSVSRVVSIAPEDKLSRASIFATVALEHRLTEADGDRLLDAGLSAAQVDALRTTLQQGQSAVGQHTTEAHQTKKGKSGLYAEFYEEINLQLYHGWERTTVVLKILCRDATAGKGTTTRVLGTFGIPASSIRDHGCAGFYDVVPAAGSEMRSARVKVELKLEEATRPTKPENTFAVKSTGMMGGARRVTLNHDDLTVHKSGGELELRCAYSDLKRVSCDGAEVLMFAAPGHLQTPARYVASSAHDATGLAAVIQARRFEFTVDIALPFLITQSRDQSESEEQRAKLAATRASLRRSSADAKHSLTHQSSLSDQTNANARKSVVGDGETVRISPIAQLNCNLLLADVTNDVGKAIEAFGKEWQTLRKQTDVASVLQRVRVFVDTVIQYTLEHYAETLGQHAAKLVEAGVEEQVLSVRYQPLIALSRPRFEEKEARLQNLRSLVRGWSQQKWGIAEDLVSPLEFCAARGCLQEFAGAKTPSAELTYLTNCATAIYREMQAGQKRGRKSGSGPKVVGADEFTPVFIFVVCLSGANDLHARCENLWALASPTLLAGEAGYYLTQLQ